MKPKKAMELSPVDNYLSASWEALGQGAPVLVALAQLSARAFVDPPEPRPELTMEAKALLCAARERGVIIIKSVPSEFQSTQRLLAVYVEIDDEHSLAFRDPERAEATLKYLEAFRQLCFAGYVVHHLHCDFTLTQAGFDLAHRLPVQELQRWIDQAIDRSIHE